MMNLADKPDGYSPNMTISLTRRAQLLHSNSQDWIKFQLRQFIKVIVLVTLGLVYEWKSNGEKSYIIAKVRSKKLFLFSFESERRLRKVLSS